MGTKINPANLIELRIGPDLAPVVLPSKLGQGVRSLIEQAQPDINSWRVFDYTFERVEEARVFILGRGTFVEVIARRNCGLA